MNNEEVLDAKTCIRCGAEAKYTLQVYEGEPLKEAIAEEDCTLCLLCRIALHLWIEQTELTEDNA